ncbi:MAG: glycogen-binding domain-containing protein [Verrucomicrobia subdivision 3 bacterium]|nr:glycogen-binding domain-containing protein [Limisphaerales bacterium]
MAKKRIQSANGPATSPKRIEVEFVYESNEAKEVHVAGDFNNWSSHSLPMHKDGEHRWQVRVPLAPGRYEYRYIVDGDWQNDPYACGFCLNDFGSCNCVVEVSTQTGHAPESVPEPQRRSDSPAGAGEDTHQDVYANKCPAIN